jgi:hypothetical protein
MRKRQPGRVWFLLAALASCGAGWLLPAARADEPAAAANREIAEALRWVRSAPESAADYEYVMTVRVRLLLFWAGKDDVGGGYIRRGFLAEDRRQELIQVLFGSDPAKAPRAINRWGAGTEIVWHKNPAGADGGGDDVVSSAFFGFMKSSRGKSAAEMQEELKKERERGEHSFTGILSRVDAGRAVSVVVPLASQTDFTLHQYAEAEPLILEKLGGTDRPIKEVKDLAGCGRASEFLATVSELVRLALQGEKAPKTLCYVYDAQVHTLRMERAAPVKKLTIQVKGARGGVLVERTYDDLLEVEFVSTNKTTGKRSEFTIEVGTKNELRGVPVQIRYQPNWWFQVVLNLRPESLQQSAGMAH